MKELLKTLKKGFFPSLIALSALSVSLSAAFYSVSGLSKLFAGASTEVIIMAGSLEVAKLVIASLLYRYWDTLNKYLRTYLSIATVVLVLITSMGIYGFLSAAYQETYSKLSITENEKSFIQQKVNFYEKDVTRFDKELERISSNISNLSNARSQSIQVRDTSVAGGVRTTISTSEIRLAQNRIKSEEENRKGIRKTRQIAADSLQKFQLQVLELENDPEIAGELGPLQYLSGLTGVPMDKIINILLLVIIFVFDPLAISLVVAANFAFDKAFEKNLYGEYSDTDALYDDDSYIEDQVKTDINDIEVDAEVIIPKGPYSSRMDIIGQNGNDGEHYEKETPLEDAQPVKIIQKGPTNHNVLFSDGTQKRVSKDDNIIRYL
jgi:hypothetical protein|tara:strand:+ start:782 stop:1918 length:1137 start_codon:yes stop_codon:yes gene_type:complete